MHLQVRSAVRSSSGGSLGAERRLEDVIQADPIGVRPGSLRDLLGVLRRANVNLRTAGGHAIETTGEFVFAVAADEDHDEEETFRARDVLRDAGYPADVVAVHHADLKDAPGSLEEYIAGLPSDEVIHEIFVGTPNDDRTIPVQLTTLRIEASGSGSMSAA